MTRTVPSTFSIFIFFLLAFIQLTTSDESARASLKGLRPNWISKVQNNRNENPTKWTNRKTFGNSNENRSPVSNMDTSDTKSQYKGCTDPSEPFQCPQSEQCIPLHFVCDGNPGDCPDNSDENEETCIAIRRPPKETIENFLTAEFTLHGLPLLNFVFGKHFAANIKNNRAHWFNALASAFSVSKNINSFGKKLQMSPEDLAHFRNVIQVIHDGRLEEIPLFAQDATSQGFASFVEQLYESGFMDE